jgi:lysophospholipase L1-like esterase
MLLVMLICFAAIIAGILVLEWAAYLYYKRKPKTARIVLEFFLYRKQITHYDDGQQNSSQQSPVRFAEHPFTGFSLNPEFVNAYSQKIHNRQGFRCNYNFEDLDPEAVRIYFAGDSVAYCSPIERNEETWPAYLETELQERLGRKVQVINAGVAGFNTFQSYIRLSAYMDEIRPHLVVVYHHARNDLLAFYNGPPQVDRALPDLSNLVRGLNFHQMGKPINPLARSTYIGKVIALKQLKFQQYNVHYYIFNILSIPDAPALLERRFDLDIVKNMHKNMKGLCTSRGVPLVYVTQKIRSKMFDPYIGYVNDSVRELADRDKDCYLCDLETEFSSEKELYFDKLHFSQKGGREAAVFLADYLENAGLSERLKTVEVS